jgi:signal transduction histidine kinase
MFTPATGPVIAALLLAGIVGVFWPATAARALPAALIGLGLGKFAAACLFGSGGYLPGFGPAATSRESAGAYLVVLQAWAFLAAGSWLAWRTMDRQSRLARVLLWAPRKAEDGPRRPRWGLLLLPAALMLAELVIRPFGLGPHGARATVAIVLLVLILIALLPAVAADLALAALIALGLYGITHAAQWSMSPVFFRQSWLYGAVWVNGRPAALLAGLQGLALLALGLWLVPRALDSRTRALFWPARDTELAGRVEQLTQTRADAVDTAAAELRRVERDLHDGAQARLVALGMSLRAAERLIISSPQAALELVGEAIQTSSKALTELRDLVRGIYPPVLADRGLGDAVQALALDTPLHTEVDIDLPGRPDLPVESACYFAVAEALANAVKHSGARHVQIRMQHAREMLRIEVIDDGAGGADPDRGSGLRGLERRLGTFDGILAVSSPAGGPTIVVIEVPCALSSLKTSSC